MKFSVIMAARNAELHIQQSLESLLSAAKNYDVEILVVDDASNDKTGEIVDSISDDRIRRIRSDARLGEELLEI